MRNASEMPSSNSLATWDIEKLEKPENLEIFYFSAHDPSDITGIHAIQPPAVLRPKSL